MTATFAELFDRQRWLWRGCLPGREAAEVTHASLLAERLAMLRRGLTNDPAPKRHAAAHRKLRVPLTSTPGKYFAN
jgi:hypothetical protein